MIPIDNESYREFHFLSTCYGEGITDEKVYTLFVTKVLSEFQPPVNIAISKLSKHILEKYGIEIPPTFIKEVLLITGKACKEVLVKKDNLVLASMPEFIIDNTKKQQEILDADSSLIFEEFKYHMYITKNVDIDYKEFNTAFTIYCKLILKQEYTHTNVSSVMTEWIFLAYRKNKNNDLVKALDRMIYSWLLYTYYYSIKRSNKKLYGFQIVFDTNVIAYLLNINGNERKYYVEYLLEKMKTNNCSVIVNSSTIKELNSLLDADDLLLIKIFKNEYPEIVRQIRFNPEEYLKSFFSNYGISIDIRQTKEIDPNNKKYSDMFNDLRKYKGFKKLNISDYSVLHDIILVNSFGDIHKVTNIYADKKLIGTCDNQLYNWFSKYLKREYDSDFSYLLSLDKLNLIFWIETDKANSSSFLSNTWMYVTETLGYFKDSTVDEYFKKLRDKYYQNPSIPDNWRSLYVLIENASDVNIDEINEDDLERALEVININAIKENKQLQDEIVNLKAEITITKIKIEENKKTEAPEVPNIEKHKTIDDYSLFELIRIIIKKIFSFFRRKP
jgi:hypothetical protein